MSERWANTVCCTGGVTAGVALLCCLSVGPVVVGLTAVGLGFLLTDLVLIPLLVGALGLTLWGLWLGGRIYGSMAPLGVAGAGGVAAVFGVFAAPPVAYAGIVLVLGAVMWSVIAVRRARHAGIEAEG